MVPPDDEIPDLFPSQPSSPRAKPAAAAPRPGAARPRASAPHPSAASPRPAKRRASSPPPRAASPRPAAQAPAQRPASVRPPAPRPVAQPEVTSTAPAVDPFAPPPTSKSKDALNFEVDYGEGRENSSATEVMGTPDELEFDPTSVRSPAFEEFRPAPAPASAPALSPHSPASGSAEETRSKADLGLELDFSEPVERPPTIPPETALGGDEFLPPSGSVSLSGGNLPRDLGEVADDLELDLGSRPHASSFPPASGPISSPPAQDVSSSSPPAPSPRPSSPPVSSLQRSSAPPHSQSLPRAEPSPQGVMELNFDEAPPENGTGASVAPGSVPSLSPAGEKAPANAFPAAGAPSNAETVDMSFPGLAGEVDLGGGLDDLDFADAGSAQLNVGIPMPSDDEEELPWPTGLTPLIEDVLVNDEDVEELSGFGPAPTSFFHAPMYFLRVFVALRELKEKQRTAAARLSSLELSRDEKLARLAENKRGEIGQNDRFAGLYSKIQTLDQTILSRRQALDAVDSEGANELREVQRKIDSFTADRLLREKDRDQEKAIVDRVDVTMARAAAVVRRAKIQVRNLDDRKEQGHDFGVVDYETRVQAQRAEAEEAVAVYERQKTQRVAFASKLEEAEDRLRRVVADFQSAEAEKEGILMAHEGDIAACSRELDEAVLARQTELADASRAILDLRGEVKVDVALRRELLTSDESVREAFNTKATVTAAFASMDPQAFALGRAMWITLGASLFLLGLLAMIF